MERGLERPLSAWQHPSTLVGRSAAFLAVEGLGVRGMSERKKCFD
jgi:hypothetical protein